MARPLFVVVNSRSGCTDKSQARAAIEGALREGAAPFCFVEPRAGIVAACESAARSAAREGGALVACGGDGTINAAANAARDHGVPLGVVPLGTFNYFARQHGVPDEPGAAAQALAAGVPQPVPMGEVNGRLFFNNAAFGLYRRMIERREQAKERFGRHRIVGAPTAALALLEGQPPFAIGIVGDGVETVQRTSMVVVACNSFQLEALGLSAAACSRAGALGVMLLKPTKLADRLRLLLRTALRDLDEDQRLVSFCSTGFEVHSRRRMIELVVDGEIVRMASPLRFRAVEDAVQLLLPPVAAPAAEAEVAAEGVGTLADVVAAA